VDEAFHPPQLWRQLLGAAVRSAAGAPGMGEDYTYRRWHCPVRTAPGDRYLTDVLPRHSKYAYGQLGR
jgi:hypothetical protein